MEKETKAETKTKTVQAPAPEPNTIYTGKAERWNKETNKVEKVAREAPLMIIDGANRIKLPDAAEQAAGFHLDDASRNTVFNLFPNDFKRAQKTGESV